MWHDSFTWVTCTFVCVIVWHDSLCDMTHGVPWLIMWHDSFKWGTCKFVGVIWLIYVQEKGKPSRAVTTIGWCVMTYSHLWHYSFTCVTWLIYMCDVTWLYMWHDSWICLTRLVYLCDMTHSRVWHDSFTCVTWLILVCDMTHLCARGGQAFKSLGCNMLMCHVSFTSSRVCDMTHSRVWHDSFTCTRWSSLQETRLQYVNVSCLIHKQQNGGKRNSNRVSLPPFFSLSLSLSHTHTRTHTNILSHI